MSKVLIFDFFDVVHRDPMKAWFKLHGLERDGAYAEASDLLDQGKINLREYYERFAAASGQTPEAVIEEFRASAKLDEDVFKLLHELQDNYPIGLLSNTVREEIDPILELHNLSPLFDHIVVSADVGMSKPDPKIFLHMLQLMNVEAQDAVFIDDTLHNVEAAQSIGIAGIQYLDISSLRAALRQHGIKVAAE